MLDESPDSVPITLNQERRLAFEEASLLTGSRMRPFHLIRALQLDGALDEHALRCALELLVQRHGALRTAFGPGSCDRRARLDRLLRTGVVEPGMYRQTVCRQLRPNLEIRRLSSEAPALDDTVFARSAQEVFHTPFEYARPPLFRAVLIERPRSPHTLLLVVHHLVSDRESMRVLQRDLQCCYDHVVSKGRSPLGPVPPRYETLMRSLDQAVRGPDIANAVGYWQRQWSLYESAQLRRTNFDCPLPEGTGSTRAFGEVRRTLDRNVLERIEARARASKVTVYVIGAAALAILLAEYTRTQAVVIWSNVDNRWKLGADDGIAWLVHSHMLGIEVRPGWSGDQHLANVRAVVLGAMSHGHLPLSELWSREGRSLANGFRVTFGLTKVDPADATAVGRFGVSMRQVPIPGVQSLTSDLEFLVLQSPDSISFAARYWTHHFSAAFIEQMVERYVAILEGLVADTATPLAMSSTASYAL